jgi:1-acyl-sn-glycerol-3-phosphate acyltransferase
MTARLWARLAVPAQRIVPVLLSYAERSGLEMLKVKISYRAMMRYSGLRSFNAVSGGLRQLAEIGWLQRPGKGTRECSFAARLHGSRGSDRIAS